jgi:hypothetical protein
MFSVNAAASSPGRSAKLIPTFPPSTCRAAPPRSGSRKASQQQTHRKAFAPPQLVTAVSQLLNTGSAPSRGHDDCVA